MYSKRNNFDLLAGGRGCRKQARKKLSDRYFRRVARSRYDAKGSAKGRKVREVIPKAEMVRDEDSAAPSSDLKKKKKIRIRFFGWHDSIYKLNRVGICATRRTPTGLVIRYSNFGIPSCPLHLRLFFESLELILSFAVARPPASCYSRFPFKEDSSCPRKYFTTRCYFTLLISKSPRFFVQFWITTVQRMHFV